MNIEGLGESLVDQLVTTGLVHDYADLYQLNVGPARRARPHGQEVRRQSRGGDREEPAGRALAAAARHRHPPRRRGRRPGARRRVPLDAGAAGRVGRGRSRPCRTSGRSWRVRCAPSSTSRATPTCSIAWPTRACAWRTRRTASGPRSTSLAGQTFVHDRHARVDEPRAGGRGASRELGGKVAGSVSRKTLRGWSSGATPGASSRRRRR